MSSFAALKAVAVEGSLLDLFLGGAVVVHGRDDRSRVFDAYQNDRDDAFPSESTAVVVEANSIVELGCPGPTDGGRALEPVALSSDRIDHVHFDTAVPGFDIDDRLV